MCVAQPIKNIFNHYLPTDMNNALTPEQHRVMRENGTEAPFSGKLLQEHRDGTYRCAGCNTPLFASDAKFDSGTGWPSFDRALPGALLSHDDTSHGILRTEIRCATCDAHLGHVFPDGPTATGQRYCLNSVCLSFNARNSEQSADTSSS